MALKVGLTTITDETVLKYYSDLIFWAGKTNKGTQKAEVGTFSLSSEKGAQGIVQQIGSKILEPTISSKFKLPEGFAQRAGSKSEPDYVLLTRAGVPLKDYEGSIEYKLLRTKSTIDNNDRIDYGDTTIKIGGKVLSQLSDLRDYFNVTSTATSSIQKTKQKTTQEARNSDKYEWYERKGNKQPAISKLAEWKDKAILAYDLAHPKNTASADNIESGLNMVSEKETAQNKQLLIEALQQAGTKKVIQYLKDKQEYIYRDFEIKAKNVMIVYPVINAKKELSLPTAVLSFSGRNWLSERNFYFKYEPAAGGIVFKLYIRNELQKSIQKDLLNSLTKLTDRITGQSIQDLTKAVESINTSPKIVKNLTSKDSNLNTSYSTAILGHGNPGSIPQGGVSAKIPRRKSSAFTSRTMAARQTLAQTRVKTPSMGSFISNDTITALTKREMMRRMPIGPVGGRPLSPKVLTYRTGRFVQSLEVFADMRTQSIQYYYNPLYWVHETTSRNPRNLIGSSINSVTRSLFGKRFNLIKAEQSVQ